jgi:kinesin family member 20
MDFECDLTSADVKLPTDVQYAVFCSFAEIYNEQIFDLLVPPSNKRTARRQALLLREDRQGRPYIKGLSAEFAFQI